MHSPTVAAAVRQLHDDAAMWLAVTDPNPAFGKYFALRARGKATDAGILIKQASAPPGDLLALALP